MSYWKAILLGLVQGLTEFLPISSSGHLSVFQFFMGNSGDDVLLFNVLLHIGTLAAVFICFRLTIWHLILEALAFLKDIFTGKYHIKTIREDFQSLNDRRKMLVYFVVSCVPLLFMLLPAGGGQSVMDKLSVFSTDKSILAEGFCFLLTGVVLVLGSIRAQRIRRYRKMDFFSAFTVGVAQLFAAALPGVSRSGSTISAGLLCGVSKNYMVQYSFILGIPAILAANLSELKDAVEMGSTLSVGPAIVGILTAAVSGIAAIVLLRWILKKDLFRYFGYYCAALGVFCIGTTIVTSLTA